jgi:hypothetical protein
MIVISVTLEDIRNGKQGHGFSCPIALALRRAGFGRVAVGRSRAEINGRNVTLPLSARYFIGGFDRHPRYVKPFSFPMFTGGK